MLVLSRKPGEKIIVECPSGDVISVVFVHLGPVSVRLGVEAPTNYNIAREELLHAPCPAKNSTKECSEDSPAPDGSGIPVTHQRASREELLVGDHQE